MSYAMQPGYRLSTGGVSGEPRRGLQGVRLEVAARRAARGAAEEAARGDAVVFARERLGFTPDALQEAVLRGGKRGILNCSRQWGKTTVVSIKALHRAVYEPGSLILVASPGQARSAEMVRFVRQFAGRIGMPGLRGDGIHKASLVFPNGSRVVGLPARPASVVGFSASLLIVDEAALVPDELYDFLTPTLAATDGDCWLLSTPNGMQGFFWQTWVKAGADWTRIEAPASACPRIRPEFLAREKERMPESRYRQFYCCEFTEREGAVFTREAVERMFTDSEKAEEL
ncbi:MAG: terminase family protein [Bryobacteraceae bacterium]|nr:terminase family protein [Bryobacteraceae bacterium]